MVAALTSWARDLRGRDDGFTLSELLVVIVLLGLVLGIAWNVNYYVTKVANDASREASFSAEVRTPLAYIDKLLMQNSLIESDSTAYRLSFLTDVDLDDVLERTVVEVVGEEMTLTRWTVDGSRVNNVPAIQTMTLSDHNANIAQGIPLFTYFDVDGDPITDQSQYSSNTRGVETVIVVDYEDEIFQDSRYTYFRNRR